ncbi:MAG TPA: hypothetical protein VGE45_13140 [Chloroflexia bacterium]|jgi:hypothetical protein
MRSISISILLGIGIWFLASVAMPASAHACSCAPYPSPNEMLDKADIVFSGKVLSIRVEGQDGPEDAEWYRVNVFQVGSVWKGRSQSQISVATAGNPFSSCDTSFDVGENYLVYAFQSDNYAEPYAFGGCSRTTRLQYAEEDLKALGKGKQVGELPGMPESGEADDSLVSISIVALLSLVLGIGIKRVASPQRGKP